jgi:hypothetical protein
MILPTVQAPAPAPSIDGTAFLVMGAPKSGKSHLVNKWPECLVLDTQNGHRFYGGLVVDLTAGRLETLREALTTLLKDCPYEAVALDTLDDVSAWAEEEALRKDYTAIQDIPHGAGWLEHRSIMVKIVRAFLRLPCTKLFVAHSRALIDEESGESTKMIDLPGRLAHIVPGEVDHIGISYRNQDGEYRLSFAGYESQSKTTEKRGEIVRQGKLVVHAGSRISNLNGADVASSYEAIVAKVKGEE